jgi:hypothetical protein
MVNIDKSQFPQKYKDAVMHPMLSNFVCEVALIKPTADFYVDENCTRNRWRQKEGSTDTEMYNEIDTVMVRQDGEQIGHLSIKNEYRNGANVEVYGVGSFRINKSRGRSDETTTKDLKVALRNVKKLMIGRDYTEIAHLIRQTVVDGVRSIVSHAEQRIAWGVNSNKLDLVFSLLSYEARQRGLDQVVLPSDPKEFVRNIKDHDKEIVKYLEANALQTMIDNKQGYGLSLYSTGSCALYDFATDSVRRFKSTDELPDAVQSRLGMFKVFEVDDPHAQFGCKFHQDMYFIVSGELKLES